ncbi:MAG: PAS domain S-box protein [Anaerolineales bacterium]|nr:PAS domain S-box protein [Anaerolineales bacterium]
MTNRNARFRANRITGSAMSDGPGNLFFNHNPLPMWVYDLETYQFLEVNHAAVEKYGWSEAEFLSMTIKDIRPTEDVPRLVENVEHVTEGLDEAGVWRHIRKDGSLIFVEIVSHTLEYKGRHAELVVAMDVTERKQAEKALRESEERFRSYIENANDNIFTLDLHGRITSANRAMYEKLGCTESELLGKSALELAAPEWRAEIAHALQRIWVGESIEEVELPIQTFDGKTFIVQIRGRAIYKDGKLVETLHIARDVTEQKRAEQEIKNNEERFRALIEHGRDNISLLSASGELLWESLSASSTLGFAPNQFVGRNIFELMHPEDLAWTQAMFEQVVQTPGESKEGIFRLRHNDGSWRWIEATATNLLEESHVQAVVVNYRDISARKQAEASLRLRGAALEAAANAIVITDTEGIIQWINPAFTRLTGYSMEEAVGKNPRILKSGTQNEAFYKELWDTIHAGKPWHGELTNKRKDGLLYHEEQLITPLIDSTGQITHFIAIKQDITERKRTEAEIRQRVRELETVNRISIALRASSNQKHALAILLEEIINVFDTRHGVISLWDPETERLNQVIARGWLAEITERPIRSGEGIFGIVFASGETHVSTEFASDPLTLPESRPLLHPGWGGACLPIRSNEKILGVLTLALPSQRAFRREDLRLLQTLAEMAGTTLHRMSLNQEVRLHLERLQSLRQIDMAITGSFDRRTTLETILTQVISQLEVSAADILMLDPKVNAMHLGAYQGFTNPLDELVYVPIGEGFAGIAVSEKRAVNADMETVRRVPEFYHLWQREGFSSYYAVPLIAKGHPIGVLETYQRSTITPNKEWFNFIEMIAGQAAIALENAGLLEDLESANAELMQAYDSTIEGWSHAMDLRDRETEGHTQRVSDRTIKLARQMGIPEADMIHIRRGALLHDIGKMGIPDDILLKPGPLTDEEWSVMRRHPEYAYEMLAPIEYLRPALDIPHYHHEKWDGTGYPHGLKGDEIPLAARIFAIADVWDALTSDRPYRPAWSREQAFEYIREQSGKHFDPQVVEEFFKIIGNV